MRDLRRIYTLGKIERFARVPLARSLDFAPSKVSASYMREKSSHSPGASQLCNVPPGMRLSPIRAQSSAQIHFVVSHKLREMRKTHFHVTIYPANMSFSWILIPISIPRSTLTYSRTRTIQWDFCRISE